jgi:hypothetical protein
VAWGRQGVVLSRSGWKADSDSDQDRSRFRDRSADYFIRDIAHTRTTDSIPRRYAVTANGQRFLVASAPQTDASNSNSVPITAVVNWTAALHKK